MAEVLVGQIRLDLKRAEAELRRLRTSLDQTGTQGAAGFRKADAGVRTFSGGLGLASAAARLLGPALAGIGLVQFGQQAIKTSVEMQGLDIAFKTILGSAKAGRDELKFIRGEADRLGIRFKTLADASKGLTASLAGTSLQGEQTRKIFTAVSEAARVLNLSSADVNLAITALSQIAAKGVVSMEELRQQLGERIPGAFRIAAEAMGVTTAELTKMVESGTLAAEEFLPRFADALSNRFAPGVEDASNTFAAATARFQTALDGLSTSFGDLVTQSPLVIDAITGITAVLNRASTPIDPLVDDLTRLTKALDEQRFALQELKRTPFASLFGGIDAGTKKVAELEIALAEATARYQDVTEADSMLAEIAGTTTATIKKAKEEEAEALGVVAKLREKFAKDALVSTESQTKAEVAAILRALADETRAREQALKDREKLAKQETETELREIERRVDRAIDAEEIITRERIAGIETRAREVVRREREQAQQSDAATRERMRDLEQFAGRVENRLADVFQQALNGELDILETMKQAFFATISQMAAKAATSKLVIPIVTGVPAGGSGGGLLSFLGFGSAAGAPAQGGTTTSPVQVPGGGTALTIVPGGGTGAAGGTPSAAGPSAAPLLGSAALGLGVGAVTTQLLEQFGITGTGNTALSGAAGGAAAGGVLGSFVFPGIGTAAGAGAGAGIGALLGLASGNERATGGLISAGVGGALLGPLGLVGGGILGSGVFGDNPVSNLFGKKKEPDPKVQLNEFFFELSEALDELTVEVGASRNDVKRKVRDTITAQIGQASETLLGSVLSQAQGLPDDIRNEVLGSFTGLAEQFGDEIKGVQFDGKRLEEEFQQFMQTTLPETFGDIFGDLVAEIENTEALLAEAATLTASAAQLTSAAGELRGSIQDQIDALSLSALAPSGQFESGMDRLAALQGQLIGAGSEETLELSAQISRLVGSLFELSGREDVLGQDRIRLGDTRGDLLQELRRLQDQSEENLLAQSTRIVAESDALLAQVPSFQGLQTPMTFTQPTLAQIHPGETLLPANGRGATITNNITINAAPGMSSQDVASAVIRETELRSRFRQTSIVTRRP